MQDIHAVSVGPALPDVPVRVPETYTEFVISEIRFRVDGGFQYSRRPLRYWVLFTLEGEHARADPPLEEVLANLMYTLKSVRFKGPEVTEEDYQTKIHLSEIHLSEIRNCTYMAAAYIKTDYFGHESFVDVYVPYSDAPIYASDGRAIRTEAHRLRVYASIFPGENAKEIVEARQQVLASWTTRPTGKLWTLRVC